jgi:hypothetical protein
MGISPVIWLSAGLLVMGLEVVIPGFYLFWFGVGAALTALLSWLGVLVNSTWQWAFFLVASLVLLMTWHLWLKRLFRGKVVDEMRDPTVSDRRGRISRAIEPPVVGEVELFSPLYGNRKWQAEAEAPIAVGVEVTVVEASGIRLLVKPVADK